MAAVYLHNALFSPEPLESPSVRLLAAHGRHRSSQSITTLRTSFSEHSHPTEPLLDPSNSGSSAYMDLLSRQPTHPSGPQPGWDLGLTLTGEPATVREKKGLWEQRIKKRLRRLKIAKAFFEILIGLWAIYNTVRYFVAFTIHPSRNRQSVCLALGTSTTLSITLLLASALISSCSDSLLLYSISTRTLVLTQMVLSYFASFFVFAPAVVSFSLVFVWRHSSDPDLRLAGRCFWDIDTVWTGIDISCASAHVPSWGVWLVASTIRLIFTLTILAAYHIIYYDYNDTRRPLRHRRSILRRQQVSTRRLFRSTSEQPTVSNSFPTLTNSEATLHSSSNFSGPKSVSPPGSVDPSKLGNIYGDHQPLRRSHSGATPLSRTVSFSRTPSLRRSMSFWQDSSAEHAANSERLSGSSSCHGGEDLTENDIQLGSSSHSSGFPSSGHNDLAGGSSDIRDADLYGFVDRFQSLVTQISTETDEVELARPIRAASYTSSSGYANPFPPSYSQDDTHAVSEYPGYDDLARLAPVDEHVRVLGEYIRRMPTIESLGSREMTSLANTSIHRDGALSSNLSAYTLSRPPTRANTLSTTDGSQPPSRNNSLNTGLSPRVRGIPASILINEMGELVRDRNLTSSPSPTSMSYYSPVTASDPGGAIGDIVINEAGEPVRDRSLGSSHSSVSRSTTMSYQTAGSKILESPIIGHGFESVA